MEKFGVKILGSAGEEKVDFDPVTVFEEFRGFFGLHFEIVFTGTDFNLERLGFGGMDFGPSLFSFARLNILEFAKIHDFSHWRNGIRWDFDQVHSTFLGQLQGFGGRQNAQVAFFVIDDAKLLGANFIVDPDTISTQVRGIIAK